MAKKATVKKVAKKVAKKVLDSTEIDEKIVMEYLDHKSTYDLIACYIKCYGGYVLAVGAGCTFGVDWRFGLGLLIATAGWAYWTVCGCKLCNGAKKGSCCNE